jgi:hypothetical protein
MLCEKGMTNIEVRNALLVSHSTKHVAPTQTNCILRKIDKYCTNCGMTNHNVETCRKKKEQTIVSTTEATQPNLKPQKTSSYASHVYVLNGHKMIDCIKFAEM